VTGFAGCAEGMSENTTTTPHQAAETDVAGKAPSMDAGLEPVVEITGVQELAPDLLVIPNRGIDLVPNVGIIGGTEAVLVIETGMGPANATTVLDFARDHAAGRRLYLTTTHFHPEHAFGAQVFAGEATYLANRAQAEDLATKGAGYVQMFRGLGENVARQLEGVRVVEPDVVYDDGYDLDLGGRVVHLRATGRAHTRGDQIVTVPDAGVMFTGDLVETGQFPIFPWFPPYDTDVSGLGWLTVMDRLITESPVTVVPGHGVIGGCDLLVGVRDTVALLRDETFARRARNLPEDEIAAEVAAVMVERHPEWHGREWITTGVGCLCFEYDATQRDAAADGGVRR
jgi:glyoxylase-like metal-dependent hydrolase (beta-lactamase superfamily II)